MEEPKDHNRSFGLTYIGLKYNLQGKLQPPRLKEQQLHSKTSHLAFGKFLCFLIDFEIKLQTQ